MDVNWVWVAASVLVGIIVTGFGATVTGVIALGIWLLKDYLNHRNKQPTGMVTERNCETCKGDTLARVSDLTTARREDREAFAASLLKNSEDHGKLFACLSKIEAELGYVAGFLRNGSAPTRRSRHSLVEEDRHL